MDLYDDHSEAKAAAVKALMWGPIQNSIQELNAFARVIEDFVDIEYADKNDTYRIKPEKNDQLTECFEAMERLEKEAKRLEDKVGFAF
jgi:hypothetical protein